MKIVFLGIYPQDTIASYLLSTYVLKAHLIENLKDGLIEIDVLNMSNISESDEICNLITIKRPEIIAYSCYTWNIGKVTEVIQRLGKAQSYTHILGGPEISLNVAMKLSQQNLGDYFIIGEGEKKLLNLILHLTEPKKHSFPKGVLHREFDNVIYEECTSFIDLNNEPSVYLSGAIDNNLYRLQQAFLETQRGCKYKCKYCVYHKSMSTINYIPLERIFNELDHLIRINKIRALRIIDAIFTSNLERSKQIVKYLINLRGDNNIVLPKIYWEFDYNSIDEDFINLVSKLKCKDTICNSDETTSLNRSQIYTDMIKDYTAINCVGLQSFNKETLKAVGRMPFNIEEFEWFMDVTIKYNVVAKLDIILGLPYETYETYFDGLEFLLPYLQNTDHVLNIHLLQIIPGSLLEDSISKYKIGFRDDSSNIVVSTNTITEDELKKASKLTAILFRIVNSPLRKYIFYRKNKDNIRLRDMLEEIYNELSMNNAYKDSILFKDCVVDDIYWNKDVFKEIKSDILMPLLTK